jgi:hypothetical protein
MPTLSASDYTNFIKIQAAAQSYRNGAIPTKIQTSDQVVPTQSILNAQLLASQASYVAASPATVKTALPAITAVSTNTVTAAQTDILSAASANVVTAATGSSSAKTFTYTTNVSHGIVVGDLITITNLSAGTLTSVNVSNLAVTSVPSPTTFVIFVAAGAQDGTITAQTGQLNIGNLATATAYYTSSVPHGLSVGTSITITGFTTLGNVTSKTVTRVIDSTHFAVANNGTATGVGTGTGSITNLVYYTTSVAHGLVAGQTNVNIVATGGTLTNFTASNLTVANVADATHFALTSATTGSAITGQTGRISGYVYYTTATAHSQTANILNTLYTITGLTTTTAFNLAGFTISSTPDATTFVVTNATTGTAITGQSGGFERITTLVPRTVISGNVRIRPFVGVGYVNQPKSLSAVTRSGTLSSGKFQQVGGLPQTAAKWDGVYAPVAHLARVDTKATGAYKAVRQP